MGGFDTRGRAYRHPSAESSGAPVGASSDGPGHRTRYRILCGSLQDRRAAQLHDQIHRATPERPVGTYDNSPGPSVLGKGAVRRRRPLGTAEACWSQLYPARLVLWDAPPRRRRTQGKFSTLERFVDNLPGYVLSAIHGVSGSLGQAVSTGNTGQGLSNDSDAG